MARVAFLTRVIDEAGNALGGSPTEVRIFDDFLATAATTVTDDTGGGTTIAQPIIPNAGTQTTLTVTTGTGDTTITVSSTTGFSVGQLIPLYDGTVTKYFFIRAILSGPPRLTLERAVGTVFSNTNTAVGNPDMLGVVAGYVSDTTFHYIQTKDVASTRVMPPTLIPTSIGVSAVAVAEEGVTVGTRALINFIGDDVTAVDNAGATRVDVTVSGTTSPNLYHWHYEGLNIAGLQPVVTGTGAITALTNADGQTMITGTTNPSSCSQRSQIRGNTGGSTLYRLRRGEFRIRPVNLTNARWYIYFTEEAVDTAPSATVRHLGIKNLNGVVSFTTADGTTEQLTTVTGSFTANTPYTLVITYDGTTARLYINGTLAATHATNVPGTGGSGSTMFRAFIDNNASANSVNLTFNSADVVALTI